MVKPFKYRADDKGIYRPYIPIRFSYGNKSQTVLALLDSGADCCFIPKGLGEYLGYDLTWRGDYGYGVNSKFKVLKTHITVTIKLGHIEHIIHNVPIQISLEDTEDKDLKTFILLGRQGFFSDFEIKFREKEKKVYIKRVDKHNY